MADNEPTNPALWEKVLKLTKGEVSSLSEGGKTVQGPRDGKGFVKYPSAYANGWASKVYKDLGGGWTTKKARRFDRKHCESKTCDEMGFSEKASCRPYKNCYKSASGKHQLPQLPYAYDSLEPWISEATLRFHHDKHHQAYVDGLNATEGKLALAKVTGDLDALPLLNADLAFHWGGHYLHTIYWQCLGQGQQPSDNLKKQVVDAFGSWDSFKSMFLKSAESVQGSGWAVLVWSPLLGLQIAAITNHEYRGLWDTVVLLPIDVWEHAYYLDHQNDRKAHLESIFDNCINWSYVEQRMGSLSRSKKASALDSFLEGFFRRHSKLGKYRSRIRFLERAQGSSSGHGEARQHGDDVWVFPKFWKLPKSVQDSVMAHEIGHWVLSQYGTAKAIKQAYALGVDPWDALSLPFGQTNMDEAFADCFASYYTDGDVKRRYPEWARLVEVVQSGGRVARGKAKKDVGHGGLDEWFSGHGGAKGKGEGATWGDWVSISPVTKTLPSGKKVQKGDIVGPCGISDDPDWKAETKGGKNPLKCMPRQKAYDMPKAERAEKAKNKQKAEKSTPNSKKPTNTPTFDKKAGLFEPPAKMVAAISEWALAQYAVNSVQSIRKDIKRTQSNEKEWRQSSRKLDVLAKKLKEALRTEGTRVLKRMYDEYVETQQRVFWGPSLELKTKVFTGLKDPKKRQQVIQIVESRIEKVEELRPSTSPYADHIDSLGNQLKYYLKHTRSDTKPMKEGVRQIERYFDVDIDDWYHGKTILDTIRSKERSMWEGMLERLEAKGGDPDPEMRELIEGALEKAQRAWQSIRVVLVLESDVKDAAAYWHAAFKRLVIELPRLKLTDIDRAKAVLTSRVEHELVHMGQSLMAEFLGGDSSFVDRGPGAGMPSKKIVTPQYRQQDSDKSKFPRHETPSKDQLHHLDDVEFYTDLRDAVRRISKALDEMPSDGAKVVLFKVLVGVPSRKIEHYSKHKQTVRGYRVDRFFKTLLKYARGKWRKAVSVAYTKIFGKPFDKKASSVERVFRSPKPFTTFRNTGQDSKAAFKPKGLWYSCGSEWDDWCKWEMPHWITNSPYVYRIEVNLSRMLVIRSDKDFEAFEAKYLAPSDQYRDLIDWKSVARDYDGIEICPYRNSRRMSSNWYYPWDVASGCVWGSGAVKSVEPVETCKVAGSFTKKAFLHYIRNAHARLLRASIYKDMKDADGRAKELLATPTPDWLQRDYPYVAPPDDQHSLGELYYLSSLVPMREKHRAFIQKADEDFLTLFKDVCKQLGCDGEVDFDEVRRIMDDAAVLITKLKWKYNRARPYQIAEKYGVPFEALDSQTAHTPAYPSGHTIQAYLVASHISKIAPQHRKWMFQLADWISFSRLLGGYHWPSDVHFGKDVFRHIVSPEMPAAVKLGEEDA